MTTLDLSRPSLRAADQIAREYALDRMKAQGRKAPDVSDGAAYRARFARLLWLVRYENGGFDGASDRQAKDRALRLNLQDVYLNYALSGAGEWPVTEKADA
jgi:hypothetical protein